MAYGNGAKLQAEGVRAEPDIDWRESKLVQRFDELVIGAEGQCDDHRVDAVATHVADQIVDTTEDVVPHAAARQRLGFIVVNTDDAQVRRCRYAVQAAQEMLGDRPRTDNGNALVQPAFVGPALHQPA